MAETDMQISLGEGIRRLPVYLLLDCSSSMTGSPIEAVRHGIETFVREVQADPFARQTVHVGVITFDSDARMVTAGLVHIDEFRPPTIGVSGGTNLGKALRVLQESLDSDVRPNVKGGEKGDWKPLVFILTDGKPTDSDWPTVRHEILNRQQRKIVNVITVGCGPKINEEQLKAIAIGPSFRMDNSEESFREFFQWASQTVGRVSKDLSEPKGGDQPVDLPQPPQRMQYVP